MSRLFARELLSARWGIELWLQARTTEAPARADVLRFPAWASHHLKAARTIQPAIWDELSATYLRLYQVRTQDSFSGPLGAKSQLMLVALVDEITGEW
ncbi:MAG: hypothetical protein ACLP8S_27465 [Solirubrobacteraceae bacterium]